VTNRGNEREEGRKIDQKIYIYICIYREREKESGGGMGRRSRGGGGVLIVRFSFQTISLFAKLKKL
jgi:hypothetical protein